MYRSCLNKCLIKIAKLFIKILKKNLNTYEKSNSDLHLWIGEIRSQFTELVKSVFLLEMIRYKIIIILSVKIIHNMG